MTKQLIPLSKHGSDSQSRHIFQGVEKVRYYIAGNNTRAAIEMKLNDGRFVRIAGDIVEE